MPPSRHRRRRAANRNQRRTPPISTGGGFRSRWLLFAFGAIAVLFIVALLVPVLPFNFGRFGSGLGSADEVQAGIGEAVAAQEDRTHFPDSWTIADVTEGAGYTTTPPTSGRHWDGWVQCGFYTSPVPDERIVHNMEHGNIIVSYNLADQAQIDELRNVFNAIGKTNQWGVARPYNPGTTDDAGNELFPEGAIALTTWGVIDKWNVREVDDANNYQIIGIDKKRIERFFDAYSGKLGPEFPNGAPCTQGGVMNP